MEWQYITSKSNSFIVRISKLKDKKYRRADSLFRFDGIKLFDEAAANNVEIKYVILSESQSAKIRPAVEEKLRKYQNIIGLYIASDDVFAKLTDESSPEGIITVCAFLNSIKRVDNYSSFAKEIKEGSILMLESVRDVGNMGTIIRSAKAFSIDALIISSDCADLYNPKTIRAAMGALFTQKIYVADDMVAAITALRGEGAHVYATALNREARMLGSVELKRGDAILVGNEGHGLSNEVISASNECLFIPMEEGSESLNASIAASICIWEIYRQTKFK